MTNAGERIDWVGRYWDVLDHLYWWPGYVGLKSIPQKHWRRDGDRISIPAEMHNPSGPLYYRVRNADTHKDYMLRQEEPLNHLFNLAFSLIPDEVVSEIASASTGLAPLPPLRPIGREAWARYGWGSTANVMQHDVLLIGGSAALALELKFNAGTSLDQIAKYLFLMLEEERLTGSCELPALVYIVPDGRDEGLRSKLQSAMQGNPEAILDAAKNAHVASALNADRQSALQMLKRMRCLVITWHRLSAALRGHSAGLGPSAGDRTLRAVLEGLACAIEDHPLGRVGSSA